MRFLQRQKTTENRRQRGLKLEALENRRVLAITVDTLIDELDGSISDGDVSLRDAIAAIGNETEIDFAVSGVIHLNLALGPIVVDTDVRIEGPESASVVLDAGHGQDGVPYTFDGTRVLEVSDHTSLNRQVYLSNLTITGADQETNGGGIYSSEDLTLVNVTITHNAARLGGGLVLQAGTALVVDSAITNNTAKAGAGVYSESNVPATINGSWISGNSSISSGGGIKSGGTLQMSGTNVSGNSSGQAGGGIWVRGGNATLLDVTISGNTAALGGGIASSSDYNFRLESSTVVGNESFTAGGIHLGGGVAHIVDSHIQGNSASGGGGGIYTQAADLRIETSSLVGNQTLDQGGGISSRSSSLAILDSIISNNSAAANGGGAYIRGATPQSLVFSGNNVANNQSGGSGGGISINTASNFPVTMDSNTIELNRALLDGGGVHSLGLLEITNSSIDQNTTTERDGGGISATSGRLAVTQSSVSGNSAQGRGGGIAVRGAAVTLDESTVSGNSSGALAAGLQVDSSGQRETIINHSTIDNNVSPWGGMWVMGRLEILHSTISNNEGYAGLTIRSSPEASIEHSTITGNEDGISLSQNVTLRHNILSGNVVDLTGPPPLAEFNLIQMPAPSTRIVDGQNGNIVGVDAELEPLADNGGPTRTHALSPNSPAIDAGDENFNPNLFFPPRDYDQRGDFFPRVINARIDMGAVEFSAPEPGDFNADGNWDCADIDALSTIIAAGTQDMTFDMNDDDVIDFDDIIDPVAGWLSVGGARNVGQTGGNPFLIGDANLDGFVTGPDFVVWNDNKFRFSSNWCDGNFNGDQVVDGLDFVLWSDSKFTSSQSPWAIGQQHLPKHNMSGPQEIKRPDTVSNVGEALPRLSRWMNGDQDVSRGLAKRPASLTGGSKEGQHAASQSSREFPNLDDPFC